MAERAPRAADRARWRDTVIALLADFPRQHAALENAMGAFGEDFALPAFKVAFETADDMDSYNRVQAVERALGRVQNYVADLAEAGVKLADIPRAAEGSPAEQAFAALRGAGAIDGNLQRRLVRAQGARRRLEHGYVQVSAGDVHRAAELVAAAALEFIRAYRPWIEPQLDGAPRQRP